MLPADFRLTEEVRKRFSRQKTFALHLHNWIQVNLQVALVKGTLVFCAGLQSVITKTREHISGDTPQVEVRTSTCSLLQQKNTQWTLLLQCFKVLKT